MTVVDALRHQLVPLEPDRFAGADLGRIWEAAGRPRGRSPRQWLRNSHLGRDVVRYCAGAIGAPAERVVLDAGGKGGPILAHYAVAWTYAATLEPEVLGAGLDRLMRFLRAPAPAHFAAARRLIAEDARRRAEREAEAEVFRERARRERAFQEHQERLCERLAAARAARATREAGRAGDGLEGLPAVIDREHPEVARRPSRLHDEAGVDPIPATPGRAVSSTTHAL